jgi:hypothetical protein
MKAAPRRKPFARYSWYKSHREVAQSKFRFGTFILAREGMLMKETRKLQLHYPLSQVNQPIINHLVTDFDLEPNLLRADVDAKSGGWIVTELTGETETIDKAVAWMLDRGLEVARV